MKSKELVEEFKKNKLGPYIEVPCSLLAPIIKDLMHDKECEVINPANEAIAMGLAAGIYIASQKIPMVLIQNSGLCNTLNALTSLNQIYKIPVLLLISWRGQPGTKDAPEHDIMGSKLEKILDMFEVSYEILSEKSYKSQLKSIMKKIEQKKSPGALILKRGLIEKEKTQTEPITKNLGISRARAIDTIIRTAWEHAYFVSTNGYISREALHVLFSLGIEKETPSFYMLGSMGHALPISLGVAKYAEKNKKVIVLDGDGGCLMHLGAMASIGKGVRATKNLIHVVLDNGVYASTGSQPTVATDINFKKMAQGCGYKAVSSVKYRSSLNRALPRLLSCGGPSFLHIKINTEKDPKPRVSSKYSCEEIKQSFINFME